MQFSILHKSLGLIKAERHFKSRSQQEAPSVVGFSFIASTQAIRSSLLALLITLAGELIKYVKIAMKSNKN